MYQILVIISIIVCVLLVAIVLIQNPKGGGLASGFSSSSQMMGVQRTGDFLEKGTWGLAIFLMVLALAINVAVKGGTDQTEQKHYNITTKGATQAPVAPQPTQKQQQPLTPLNPATGKTK